jgi:two-component system CheB/CheR fusion protein
MAKKKPKRGKRKARTERSTGKPAPRSVTTRPPPKDGGAEPPASSEFPIVGVGASAGGLEAFSQLLEALPRNPGFAMVLVQHLAPQHESALPLLLSVRTNLEVVQVKEAMRVERNHVYIIPPNVQMRIEDNELHLMPRPTDRSQYTPIDFFLRSLADALQDRAIAVILSGTASDGTGGVREIKAVGGISIAQQPETAKYDGMPRAAIGTGLVDLVLSPPEIAQELVRITAAHPLRHARTSVLPGQSEEDVAAPRDDQLDQIFTLIRSATGVDFRRYKLPTIQRRLHRRIVLHKLTGIDQYLKLLRDDRGEAHALYQDILIHVTRFFRDPDSFAALRAEILRQIIESRHEDLPVRVWVPGCSTGEEAYSVAMVICEYLGDRVGSVPVQVFGTDISEGSIEHARAGFYAQSIEADVSAERLRRFFIKVDGGYRIAKSVRDLCVFARQDLTRDPPFSKLDLILCRNVLIYMAAGLQRRLMGIFHYALRPTGYLVLGAAETVGRYADLFSVADKKHRFYQKKSGGTPDIHVPIEYKPPPPTEVPRAPVAARIEAARGIQAEANRLIQERYAPPGVVLDSDLQVVQFRGYTGAYLEPAPGDPSHSVLKMAREGLLHGLRSALHEARRTRATVRKSGLRVRINGGWRDVTLEIIPLNTGDRPYFLVLFDESRRPAKTKTVPGRAPAVRQEGRPSRLSKDDVSVLEQELASSREYLQSIIQELEAANEELQSANEEVLSANEELQSTNEELDTAKEELQSTNEELNTVNEELHGRNEELSRLNSDLMNLLGSVQIAIVIVSSDLRIRRFTPMAERVLNLLPGDVGRPIGHIKPNIDCPDLEQQIVHVIESVSPSEREVRDSQGNAYSLRIRPYKNIENRIDGAVLALFDIQDSQKTDRVDQAAQTYVEALTETVREPVVVLDGALRARMVNRAFCETFGVTPADVAGRPLHELGNGQWNIPKLQERLSRALGKDGGVANFELQHEFPSRGPKTLMLSARRVEPAAGGEPLVIVAVQEVTRATKSGDPIRSR